jgi:hypothetical protein
MATTVTLPTPTIHWLLYPLLVVGICFGFYLWHSTAINDQKTLQAVATAKSSQATVDKQVTTADTTAQDTLTKQNATLQAQLVSAKTQAQQLALINAQLGTHITAPPQATIPSSPNAPTPPPVVTLPASEVPEIAKQAVDFKEAQNQVAADAVEIAGVKEELNAADNTITADDAEIKVLKGGSRFKRFFKAALNDVIVGGIGAGVGYALHK